MARIISRETVASLCRATLLAASVLSIGGLALGAEKAYWVCLSPSGVKPVQDRACAPGETTLRWPKGREPRLVTTPRISSETNLEPVREQQIARKTPPSAQLETPPAKKRNPWPLLVMIVAAFISLLWVSRLLNPDRSIRKPKLGYQRHSPSPEMTRAPEPGSPQTQRITTPLADRVSDLPIGFDRQPSPDISIPLAWGPKLLAQMEWRRFELLRERLWTLRGWPTRGTGYGADGGVDLLIDSANGEPGLEAIGQCKCYGSKPVGIEPVRALWGCRDDHKVSKAVFFALSGFTDACHAFAQNKNYQLVSGEQLLAMIKELPERVQADLLAEITQGDFRTPTCANCGIKLIARKSKIKGEQFFGCANFPRCRSTLTIPKS